MQALAASQKEKAVGRPDIKRETAFVSFYSCYDVRAEVILETVRPFAVVSHPIDGNPAHCGIENCSGLSKRSEINEMRTKLANLASSPISVDAAYDLLEEKLK